MNRKISSTGFIFGFALFTGVLPLTFTFSQSGTLLLLDTPFRYLTWLFEAAVILMLLLNFQAIDRQKLIGLAILYLVVPFSFTFSNGSITFQILNKYASSILSWIIAVILLCMILLHNKSKKRQLMKEA